MLLMQIFENRGGASGHVLMGKDECPICGLSQMTYDFLEFETVFFNCYE